MNIARSIAAKFGGVRPLAHALGVPVRTVQSWCDTGIIPAQRQAIVLEAGQALDPPLTPSDFFDTREPTHAGRDRSAAAD